MTSHPPPIPAATLIVLRDRPDGAPQIAMVERSPTLAFGAGALVFPGGRVDPGDHALVPAGSLDRGDAAARIAAIRETLEEAGVAVGIAPGPADAGIAPLRAAILGGAPFGPALAAAGLHLEPDALVPFARWQPAPPIRRIFDTRFYVARLPNGAGPGTVDGIENVRLLWATAAEVLDEDAAGRVSLMLPTRFNLQRLAQFETVEAILADARRHPAERITPVREDRDGAVWATIPAGLGYPTLSVPFEA